MTTRLKITFLFGCIVLVILALVCGSVYFISYSDRLSNIQTRLTNRAITTARLLAHSDVFDNKLLRQIDAYTELAMKEKTLQAYDFRNNRIYTYSDQAGDTLLVAPKLLDDARVKGTINFSNGKKEVVAYHYTDNTTRIVVVSAAFDEEGKRKLDQLALILMFSFAVGTFIAFASGYFFSGGLLVPIRKIADDIQEISARNLNRRIPSGSVQDEWFYLSETVNELLNRLQESFEMQRRFIANASHELSTPLAAIYSQLDVSLQKDRDAEQYREVMQSVYQDVRHLNKLTLTLLEFAHASGDAGGLVIQDIRMDEILMDLPAEVQKTDNSFIIKIDFDQLPADERQLIVAGNSELLFLAFKNLVFNACKYSGDHTAIVRLWTSAGHVHASVEDHGIGMDNEELENIFQPFYRVQNGNDTAGFGLGLSLASRIIKLHKGQIQVVSSVDIGTVFTIILPVIKV